jgi:ATP-dependent DNA ligase
LFRHACKLGLEGIVSKRLGSRYRSGRSPDRLNIGFSA